MDPEDPGGIGACGILVRLHVVLLPQRNILIRALYTRTLVGYFKHDLQLLGHRSCSKCLRVHGAQCTTFTFFSTQTSVGIADRLVHPRLSIYSSAGNSSTCSRTDFCGMDARNAEHPLDIWMSGCLASEGEIEVCAGVFVCTSNLTTVR